MKTSVFSSAHYLHYMKAQIEAETRPWGLMTRLSEAAHCQKSHLSRVLKGETHLTLEQAHGVCEFWHLAENEIEYFMTLVEMERAGDLFYRERLQKKLDRLRQAEENLLTRLRRPTLEIQEQDFLYYSSWWMQAIHVAVSVPELQTAPKIAAHLALPLAVVNESLQRLEKAGLVSMKDNRWSFSSASIHLSRNSSLISLHHKNWRDRAVFDAQIEVPESLHYTVLHSMSAQAFKSIKQMLLKTIDEYTAIANPAKEEEIVCFACDLFKV
jgi:uncharacterized protein (TIGR02147 family)